MRTYMKAIELKLIFSQSKYLNTNYNFSILQHPLISNHSNALTVLQIIKKIKINNNKIISGENKK